MNNFKHFHLLTQYCRNYIAYKETKIKNFILFDFRLFFLSVFKNKFYKNLHNKKSIPINYSLMLLMIVN